MLLESNINGNYTGFPLFFGSIGVQIGDIKEYFKTLPMNLDFRLEDIKPVLSSRMIKGSSNNKMVFKLPRKYKEYVELFNEKVYQESLKRGRVPFSFYINTDYVQFAGAHTVYSFFTLEDLKKFRGFQINNSN